MQATCGQGDADGMHALRMKCRSQLLVRKHKPSAGRSACMIFFVFLSEDSVLAVDRQRAATPIGLRASP